MNSIRIERAQNGFVVCMDDPAIIAKNRKSDGPYADPERQFVFEDEDDVIAFLSKNLDKLMVDKANDFDLSFDAAVEESESDEEKKAENDK